ncbi:MAG: hypothetical protein D6741_06020 [Planctomycetota bacterium]|nr:MAG: hypothetical protein D6741_06020 [Planctomycetota bacterium]
METTCSAEPIVSAWREPMPIRWDVLGVGAVAIDDVLFVEGFPRPNEKRRVSQVVRRCGGLTGTALLAAAAWGARCRYGGRLGTDEASQFVAKCFREFDIAIDENAVSPEHGVAYSTIVVDTTSGDRTVLAHPCAGLGPIPGHPTRDEIRSAGCVLVDHHSPAETAAIVETARELGVPVVADLERRTEGPFDTIVARIDHLIVGVGFARAYLDRPEATAAELVEALWNDDRVLVAITEGHRGCTFRTCDGNGIMHQPAVSVVSRDTTGCGDVFHGIYAAAIAAGQDGVAAIRLATAAGAAKAKGPSRPQAVPMRCDVEDMLDAVPEVRLL